MHRIRNSCLALTCCLVLLFAGCIGRQTVIQTNTRSVSRLELGVTVKSVEKNSLSIPGEIKGRVLLVTKVKPGTYAQALGIQPDDLIYKINGQRVTGVVDSYAAMGKVKDMPYILVELYREGKIMELSLDLKKG